MSDPQEKREASVPCHQGNTFPLSPAQRRLWFIHRIAPTSNAYHIVQGIHIKGSLNLEAMTSATEMLIQRHQQLRANFFERDDEPRQIIGAPYPADILLIDISATFSGERDNIWNEIRHDFHSRPFDLSHDRMLRTALVRLAKDQYLLCFTLHHIVADGWSLQVLKSDFAEFYDAYNSGRTPILTPLQAEYTDYVAHATTALHSDDFLTRLNDRARLLAESPPAIELPVDHPYPESMSFDGNLSVAEPPAALTNRISGVCRSLGITPSMFYLGAYGIFLKQLSGQEDILVAAPFAARDRVEYQDTFGYFVNTVVLRLDMRLNPTIREFAARIKKEVLSAMANQDLPLEMLVDAIKPNRTENRNPLVQTMFSFLSGIKMVPEIPGLETSLLLPPRTASIFDLTMDVIDHNGTLKISLEYNTNIFDATTIQRFQARYLDILHLMATEQEICLSAIPNLSPERRIFLCHTQLHGKPLPIPDQPIHLLISRRCHQHPQKKLLFFGEQALAALELEEKSNRLAALIHARGIERGDRVGILLPQGFEMVVASLAVLKAGGAFVPLDPRAPAKRIAVICKEAAVQAVITNQSELPGLEALPLLAARDLPATEEPCPLPQIAMEDAAYILFTSGTTGTPKGVVVSHRAFAAHCAAAREAYGISADDRYLQFSPFYFDAALEQIFPALSCGASVVLKDDQLWAAAEFDQQLNSHQITVADVPPLYLHELLLYYRQTGNQPASSLRAIVVGGEALPTDLARQWQASALGEIPLFNAYGPTEAVVTATYHMVTRETSTDGVSGSMAIGVPMPGRVLRILDDRRQQVDTGIYGELCIGGIIADGYLNQPNLTAERFITTEDGLRLYRSGDRARLRQDGTIEFAGRLDSQLKIRGFRIEPGEIEGVLRRLAGVKNAYVTTTSAQGSTLLVAYLVCRAEIPEDSIVAELGDSLPAYMIPSHYVFLPELPLTPAGKIDVKALPEPSLEQAADHSGLSPQEQVIAGIWQEVLGVEQTSPNRNFFECGGHSLLLIRLHTLLTTRLDSDIRLVDLFRYTTVAKQAQRILGKQTVRADSQQTATNQADDIAIIGMACRFPGADDPSQFWENLVKGRHTIKFFTRDELVQHGTPRDLADHPHYVAAHGALEDIDCFDAKFFGIPPTEAKQLDPQHRLFMQEAWHALEHGGYDPYRYPGRIGVFAGCGMCFYLLENIMSETQLAHNSEGYQISMATDKDFLPTRISYKFNLRGPSVNVNTACSTSLVATHLACNSLLAGECDMAIAGGATISLNQKSGYLYQRGSIMSPDGYCRAFADDAAGIVGGSGAGAVLLKRLADAVRDGDTIQAVIKGSAINNDGSAKVGFTAPSIEGQAAVIAQAYRIAKVDPRSVAYVETHGTGTELGDPVEIEALTEVFSNQNQEKGWCAVGAVKSNIGHLDTASGIAGLIKAALVVKHGHIPPSLHCEKPNQKIGFGDTPFYVNTSMTKWSHDGIRRAGVSSFGMGGTNAHLVLEQPPQPPRRPSSNALWIIPLSGENEESLQRLQQRFSDFLIQTPELPPEDVLYTLAMGRRQCTCRIVILAKTAADAAYLLAYPEQPAIPGTLRLTAGSPAEYDTVSLPGLTADTLPLLSRWTTGATIDWAPFFQAGIPRRLPLPLYPFEKKRHWIDRRELPPPAVPEKTDQLNAPRKAITDWFYVPSWRSAPQENPAADHTRLLVLHSGSKAEQAVLQSLAGKNASFVEIDNNTDLAQRFASLDEDSRNAQEILYLPLLNDLKLEEALSFCFHLLLDTIRAAVTTLANREITLTVLAIGTADVLGNDPIAPEKNLLFGPLRTIPIEYPMVNCRLIDLDSPKNPLLARELTAAPHHPLVALRTKRWLGSLAPMPLPTQGGKNRLKQGGVYLITGGGSGIGYALAEHLAEEYQARLILLCRNRIEEGDERLRRLAQAGASVTSIACDVSDGVAVAAAVAQVVKLHGRIDGVIHSAGRFGAGIIPMLDRREAEEIMTAKVSGSLNLVAAVQDLAPDFLFFCSSLTGMLGAQGQAAYTSANAFLDSLAEQINKKTGLFAVSAGWDGWGYTGMAARAINGLNPEQRTVRSIRFTPGDYWPMGEHRLDNRPVMVGTAYLDLAVTALMPGHDHGLFSIQLEEVTLLAPLTASPDEEIVLDIDAVRGKAGRMPFSINSRKADQQMEHARGTYAIEASVSLDRCDLAALQARFAKASEIQDDGSESEISGGKHWNIPNSCRVMGNEVLAHFALPSELGDELLAHPLHPALLDRATAFSILPARDPSAYLPFRFGRVSVHAPLEPQLYCLGTLRPQKGNDTILQTDVTIMNSSGEILIQIENYTLMKVKSLPLDQTRKGRFPEAENASRNAILPHEGKQVFEMLLRQEEPVVAVSTIDLAAQQKGLLAPRDKTLPIPALATEIDKMLLDTFTQLLGEEGIDPDDDIFAIGADSLTTLQAASRINEQLRIDLPIDSFFTHPTIARLAAYITETFELNPAGTSTEWEEGEI